MRKVWETIAQFHMLEAGDRVLIGVSGGPDSMALLHLLYSKAKSYDISLYMVHVNHQLRPEAEEEAKQMELLAKEYALPFCLYSVDVAEYAKVHKMSLEQAGHTVRFQCFQDAKMHWHTNKLALGHHRDDRAETLLMHMVQGCGLDGLTAMPPIDIWDKTDGSQLIRPLAQVSKDALLNYCVENGLQYFIDATNLEPDCLRNQVRLELLPFLRKYNPQISDALLRLQDSAGTDLEYLTWQVEDLWQQYGIKRADAAEFPAEVFRIQHIAIQRRLLRELYLQWVGDTANLTFVQVEQMRALAMDSDGTKQVMLFDGTVFMRQYDKLCVMKKMDPALPAMCYPWEVAKHSVLETVYGKFTVEMISQDANIDWKNDIEDSIFVDADCLQKTVFVRNRQAGDRVTLAGNGGHKSVKKLFIDKKVPQYQRHCVPLIISGEEIVWIPGYYKSNTIAVTAHTERICKLSFSKGEFDKIQKGF